MYSFNLSCDNQNPLMADQENHGQLSNLNAITESPKAHYTTRLSFYLSVKQQILFSRKNSMELINGKSAYMQHQQTINVKLKAICRRNIGPLAKKY